ncbi:PREDICTED: probable cation-transporting ATPase 13A4 [Nanorana parkeri]|uniref:probable cation-transporting ATPase 13A4 n=1 Tax=Nanorana parkeri TaxID=125878 RepID=UPI000853F32B|nr:PREDICTED: probable cation-transporting ATPase 13A4 [Nanorana parkeri]
MIPRGILNEGQENEMEMFGYRRVKCRSLLCVIGYIITLGFLKILFYWKPELDVWCHCVPCTLEEADMFLLRTTDEFKKYTKKKVKWIQSDVSNAIPQPHNVSSVDSNLHNLLMKPEQKSPPQASDSVAVYRAKEGSPEFLLSSEVRCIRVQKTHYVWNTLEDKFNKTGVLEDNLSCSDIHKTFGMGLCSKEQNARQQLCGPNTIEVKITPIWKLIFKEILNPFYCFEVYSLCTWLATGYIEYSMAILIMTILSVLATIYLLRMQSVKLHHMVESHNNVMVSVLQRNGEVEEVQSKCLVPGDVIILSEKKFFLPCDAILISGGCVVNEGMLTGESVPVTKVPLPNVDNGIPWITYTGENCRGHILYCGTEVVKTKLPADGMVKAVVLQTGFNTAKGDLVRSIIYPKPVHFKLHREVLKVLFGLIGLSITGVIYTVAVYSLSGATARELVIMTLIMATVAIPVSLPPALTICTLCCQARLKKQGIFCISPQRIILCGQLNVICFDKTGTLTEDGLDLWGIIPSDRGRFQETFHVTSGCTLPWSTLTGAMASCHSLVLLDGKVHGDPLDIKMFEGTGWVISTKNNLQNELNEIKADNSSRLYTMVTPGPEAQCVSVKGLSILHQLPFCSSLQRMSVITKVVGEPKFLVFLKGAPEVIVKFCKEDTVPINFLFLLNQYTVQGFRVIGMAYKNLEMNEDVKVEMLKKEEVEHDLCFLGFLIMENRPKPETKPVLQELKSANIRTIMVTGDNLQTACTVGLSSGMVPDASTLRLLDACEPERGSSASFTCQSFERSRDELHKENASDNKNSVKHLVATTTENICNFNGSAWKYHYAMSGKTYDIMKQHFPSLIPDILLNSTIFARMTPKQKTRIIEDLQRINYYVGMCGDGANDCGALKIAHAGISLSNLEASVASPFTSKIPNIECVPKLLKEGRNALVTSICLFKYLIMYTLIELICMMLLFWKKTLLGNYHYLMQDIAITVTVILTMSLTGPAPKLAPYRHAVSLMSPPLLLSVTLHTIFTIVIQTSAFFLVQQQPWYNETDVFSACDHHNQSYVNHTMIAHYGQSQNFLTTTLWPVTGINLIIVEFVFCKGKPFRKPIYTNYVLCILILAQLGAFLFMLFADIGTLYSSMELVCTPYYWRIEILSMLIVLFIASYGVEIFVYNRTLWQFIMKISGYKSKSHYKKLKSTLEKDINLQKRMSYSRPQLELMANECV